MTSGACEAAHDDWNMCGLAGTLLRAGSARDFMGPLGPRSATDLEGLYQGPHQSQSRTGTTGRTWTTNLLRHRDYGIDCRHSGDSPPAHIGTAPRARSSATRPAGRRYPPGCWPGQRLGGLEDSKADYCRRTRRSNGYMMLPSKGAGECGHSRVCGLEPTRDWSSHSNAEQQWTITNI